MDDQHLLAGQRASDIVEKFLLHGKLDKTLHSFAFTVAKWSGGIRLEDYGDSGAFYIRVDEDFAKPLTELALRHYHFYDLCIDILAFGQSLDRKLPNPLDEFSVGVLTGLIKRPKPPHAERRAVWLEKFLMWSLAHDINAEFGINFSENDAPTVRIRPVMSLQMPSAFVGARLSIVRSTMYYFTRIIRTIALSSK